MGRFAEADGLTVAAWDAADGGKTEDLRRERGEVEKVVLEGG